MTVVVDASALASVLIATDEASQWAEAVLSGEHLLAPHHVLAETANVIRRAALSSEITEESATRAHDDLLDLPLALCAYEPYARRIWELRQSVTVYDAWYVAIAEEYSVALVTLDRRLGRAAGPRCEFRTPPGLRRL